MRAVDLFVTRCPFLDSGASHFCWPLAVYHPARAERLTICGHDCVMPRSHIHGRSGTYVLYAPTGIVDDRDSAACEQVARFPGQHRSSTQVTLRSRLILLTARGPPSLRTRTNYSDRWHRLLARRYCILLPLTTCEDVSEHVISACFLRFAIPQDRNVSCSAAVPAQCPAVASIAQSPLIRSLRAPGHRERPGFPLIWWGSPGRADPIGTSPCRGANFST